MKIIKLLMIMVLINLFTCIGYSLPSDCYIRVTPSEVNFQVIDPIGRITGYDIQSNTILKNIPNTLYELNVEPTGPVEATKYQKYHMVSQRIISDTTGFDVGIYKIKIFGSNISEKVNINIRTYYHGIMGAQMIAYYNTMIYPNTTWTYEFTIPDVPTATGEIILTKVAQSSDLLTDLTTAGQLGYIGNAKFVSELTKEINEIEAEKAKGKVDDGLTPAQKAKKEYTELLKEITEKYNKPESDEYVKKEAYDVLKEDIEYIINHIQ